MIADIESNKKLKPVVTDDFWEEAAIKKKAIRKDKKEKAIRLDAIYYFIMKTSNKFFSEQITSIHSFDFDFKDFMKLYKHHIKNHIHFSERYDFPVK